jgi:hypothetical protein
MNSADVFEFGNPTALWLLAGILAVIALFVWSYARNKKLNALLHHDSKPIGLYALATSLWAICLGGLATAAAEPQIVTYSESEVEVLGDCVLAFDVSFSMEVSPVADISQRRLEIAKNMARQMIEELPLRCQIVAYSGLAFPLSPITDDRGYLLYVLERGVYLEVIPEEGSEIVQALEAIAQQKLTNPDYAKVSHVVLFSDGGMGRTYKRKLGEAVDSIRRSGLKLIVVGVGSGTEERIHIFDEDGNFTGRYVSFFGNETFVDVMQEDNLRKLAYDTGGLYFSQQETDRIIEYLRHNLQSDIIATEEAAQVESLAWIFASLAAASMLPLVLLVRKLY